MQRSKTWVFRLLLSVSSALLVLFLLEIGLRVAYAIDGRRNGTLEKKLLRANTSLPRNEETDLGDMVQASDFNDIVYEFKPGLDCIFRGQRVLTNSRGLRGPEHVVPKPRGTYRIVGLGDSVMFGWGCGQDDFYLRVLEKTLNAQSQPHPVYESINFAVPGYNTAMEAATFERKALEYEPDLVILQFINNDFGVPLFMLKPRSGLDWRKSYALEFIRVRLGRIKRSYEDERLVFQDFRNMNEEEAANVESQYSWMCGADGYRAAADRLGRLAKQRGIPVIVLLGTLGDDQRAVINECAKKWKFHTLDIGPYTPRALARNGIPDCEENWVQVGQVSPGDTHPTAFAHTIYTEGLMEAMHQMKLISITNSPYLLDLQKQALVGVWPPATNR